MDSPLETWLNLQCRMLAEAEAGLAFLGPSLRSPRAVVACWPNAEQIAPRLPGLVQTARERGRVMVHEPNGHGHVPTTHVALPLTRGGDRVVGGVGLSLRGLPPAQGKAVAELLAAAVRGLDLLLEARDERDRMSELISLAETLLDHEEVADAAYELATGLTRSLDCERVAVGRLQGGRLRVVALSTSLRVDERTAAVRDVRAAMEEAVDQDALIELPTPLSGPTQVARAHESLLRDDGPRAVCSLPLACRGRAVGALTCEWSEADSIDRALRAQILSAAPFLGAILDLLERAEAGPLVRARAQISRWAERRLGAESRLAKGLLATAAALVGIALLMPAPYRISAPATLEGRSERALVVQVPGFLAEANARAGDIVRAGDVLARLDERDLRLERRRLESQAAELDKEYRMALADEDRTQARIAAARIAQARARLELAEEHLARASIVAPFDGVVLEGDLGRALGSPVERGDVLFELASLEGYRIILEVDERDISDVAVGHRGRLALSALPDRPMPLVVQRITPLTTSEDGRNYFRVEAVLEEPAESLRPGMEGIAKIGVGERRRLWIWTHDLLDWLRLVAWPLLP